MTAVDDCQLVIIARGEGNTAPGIGGNLSTIQKLAMANSIFENIPTENATQAQINKMPYVMHLSHVNVTSDGKLQSREGTNDARLLLKRLATKLTVNWNLDSNTLPVDYQLKEVKLCQIPAAFGILPAPENTEWGITWPSSVAEFIEPYRLTDATELAKGTKTIWIPANVRGTSAKATSPYYRTKENAPTAASYVELVLDNSKKKERLYYRAYLGGVEPTDFNLYENTDYNWTIHIKSANYQTDNRIQLLDQTPVESTNLVPTSNCFMMIPGTNICFNPYKHEAGTGGWNTELVSNGTLSPEKTIRTVSVAWQTKDAGTSGDLVLGYVIDDNNHRNLVDVSDITDKDKALVHIKVPVTQGGNAVIQAKNSSGVVVWSWHIWISEYVPAGMNGTINASTREAAIGAAQNATKAGMVQVYGGISWTAADGAFYKCVIMDRNLGATRGGIQDNLLDRVRTFGLLYQGGRKDPFFSTADGTQNEVKVIYDGYGNILDLLKPGMRNVPYQTLIENPTAFYRCRYNNGEETLYRDKTDTWGLNGKKTMYDPCPMGWKVPTNNHVKGTKYSLFAGFGSNNSEDVLGTVGGVGQFPTFDNVYYFNGSTLTSIKTNGGLANAGTDIPGSGYLYIGGTGETISNNTSKSAFFPGVSLRETDTGLYRSSTSNNTVFIWASTSAVASNYQNARYVYQIGEGKFYFKHMISSGYGFTVRCVQDNEQP